ncbi:YoaK family protein [Peredibacter sp. HCB2-198]|uniref:YoaK family protein n=1 Tax=Peredibacter sp. HCB2-198 TaxID=3383025 RepID=UPI0038B63D8C
MNYFFLMLYGNKSIPQYSPSNIVLWFILAFQAGLLNIGGFMAINKIISHVTGFATFFGYEISQNQNIHALGMLSVPLFFLLGSMLSGYFVDLRLKLDKRPKYYITFGIIFALLSVLLIGGVTGQFGQFGEAFEINRNYALLIILCLVCGIQNGTISTVSKSVIRTTHLTGLTTDLGLGIVRILNKKKLKNQINDEEKINLVRFGIILSFILGSVAGALIFRSLGFIGFAVPTIISGILFGLMLYFQVYRPAT